jgi:hypothetical protein
MMMKAWPRRQSEAVMRRIAGRDREMSALPLT